MWTRFNDGRWRSDPIPHRAGCDAQRCLVLDGEPAHDLTTNYLLRTGDQLRELHVGDGRATLHIYQAGEVHDDAPLALAAHVRTQVLEPGDWTAERAWKALEEA